MRASGGCGRRHLHGLVILCAGWIALNSLWNSSTDRQCVEPLWNLSTDRQCVEPQWNLSTDRHRVELTMDYGLWNLSTGRHRVELTRFMLPLRFKSALSSTDHFSKSLSGRKARGRASLIQFLPLISAVDSTLCRWPTNKPMVAVGSSRAMIGPHCSRLEWNRSRWRTDLLRDRRDESHRQTARVIVP